MKECGADIKCLFEPRSIAVVGASHDTKKIGFKILQNIVAGGYKGKIYPINPQGGEILGLKVYKRLEDIGEPVDVASISIPAKFIYDCMQSCANAGVKFASIITSGFSEVGNTAEEQKIVAFAREHGIRILGPNIFGVYSASGSLNATFGPSNILSGGVAIITQSGALGLAMIGKTAVEGIGLSAIVSVGNKTDVDEADLLEYLVPHAQTRVILMYVEGVHEGEKFVQALKKATRVKPVIVIKSGRSKRGAQAAASHTGSLAGSDEIFDSVMQQCGVMRAESVKEAFNWCNYFYHAPRSAGENTLIITNGGGIGVMATDACEKYNVPLIDQPDRLREIFKGVTPDFGSTKNPIDLTGQASPADYKAALAAALKTPDIHSVIGLYCETAVFTAESLYTVVDEAAREYEKGGKPLIFCLFGGENTEKCIVPLKHRGAPVFDDVYDGVACMGALYAQARTVKTPVEAPETARVDTAAIGGIVDGALKDGRSFLLAHEGQQVMAAAGIPVPGSAIAHSAQEAAAAADRIGYPVVMKVVSRDILHKSDAGGVVLNLENAQAVARAYETILTKCKAYNPKAVIDGIEVAQMVRRGTELIVGARRDAGFGPIVMVGLGGVYVEVMKDVTFRAVPMGRGEIRAMIEKIRSYALLKGVRGEARRDIEKVEDAILKLGAIIAQCPQITDIEINPLMVYAQGQGAMAVDVRVLVRGADGKTAKGH